MFTDLKYGQVILGNKTQSDDLDDEPVFVLRAQDRRAPFAVDAYATMMEESGDVDPEFIHSIRVAAERMRSWQQTYPDVVKLPD